MSISAMKQALDVIETYSPEYMHGLPKKHYTKALRQAIEEAEKREWVGLTDEEITDLWSWSHTREAEETATTQQHAFARAIETKLKEKNDG